MASTSPGYAVTVRVQCPSSTDASSQLTTAVTRAGGSLTALDVVESHHDAMVVDVTCDATDSDHAARITAALGEPAGFSRAPTSPPWQHDAIVFALANPVPEVDPLAARQHAAVVATGRSDFSNQINNVLAFPGFFHGLLDTGASDITQEMLIAAAEAIADAVTPEDLNPSCIVPSVFDPTVAPAAAAAIRQLSGDAEAATPVAAR